MAVSRSGNRRRATDPFGFDRAVLAEGGASGSHGAGLLAGADEAGRGCLAGPLVCAAVVLDYSQSSFPALRGLTDSKLMTPVARESMYPKVLATVTRVTWVTQSPRTIDAIGLHRCNLAGLGRALEGLEDAYDLAVVDGFDLKRPELRAHAVTGADYKSAAVAAASVVAKVVRDRLMRALAPAYPEYGFGEHVGYGTPEHRELLRRLGPCDLHRLSFQGVGTPQLALWDGRERP